MVREQAIEKALEAKQTERLEKRATEEIEKSARDRARRDTFLAKEQMIADAQGEEAATRVSKGSMGWARYRR